MFEKEIFYFAHQAVNRKFIPTYNKLIVSQWHSYENQKKNQEIKLRHLLNFAYNTVPYYHKVFRKLNLKPSDIKSIENLEKLPVLTKEIIKNNWEDFKPANLDSIPFYRRSTGGSTGIPLEYRLSKYDRFVSASLLYRGWGYGGYKLGDKMVFLAGTSLDIGSNTIISKKINEFTRNIKKLSAFDMGIKEMKSYTNVINSFKPKYIRGYASSLDFFAKYIHNENIQTFPPSAIFTTSEKLYPKMRQRIGDAFNCEVYDGYGLNDGGVSAYECEEHNGLHIDTERSIMEIVSNNGNQLNCGMGRILATSLLNYSMPLIRYETGDFGNLSNDVCSCGRSSLLLSEVIGREKELLITPSGKRIHGAALYNDIIDEFKDANNIIECQIVQKKRKSLIFNMICNNKFDMTQLEYIQNIINNRWGGWDIEFCFVEQIEKTDAGKYKFIINEVSDEV